MRRGEARQSVTAFIAGKTKMEWAQMAQDAQERIAELERALALIEAEVAKVNSGQQWIADGLKAIAKICELRRKT